VSLLTRVRGDPPLQKIRSGGGRMSLGRNPTALGGGRSTTCFLRSWDLRMNDGPWNPCTYDLATSSYIFYVFTRDRGDTPL
jgi:hypothetical protein